MVSFMFGAGNTHQNTIKPMQNVLPVQTHGRFVYFGFSSKGFKHKLGYTVQILTEGSEPKNSFWSAFGGQDPANYVKVNRWHRQLVA